MTALSDLLHDAKGDRAVDSFIADAERRLGAEVPKTFRSTIYKALNGEHAARPTESTLQMLAAVFDLDVRDVRTAAKRKAGELGPWTPPDEAAQLSEPVRKALNRLIKAIVNDEVEDDEDDGTVTALPTAKPPPVVPDSAAARSAKKASQRRKGPREQQPD